MKPLGRDATDLIAAARRGEAKMTPASRATSRAKILARVGATAAAAGIAAGTTTAAATTAGAIGATAAAPVAASVGVSLVAKIGIAVVVVAGSITGVVAVTRSTSAPSVPAAVASAAATDTAVAPADRAAAPRPADVGTTPVSSAQPAASPSASAASPAKSATPVATPSASTDPLTSENELIARAQQALASGQPGQALAALDEHARRFPSGALAYEREAARAVALCRAGRTSEGRTAAAPFIAHDPESPIAQRIKSACGM